MKSVTAKIGPSILNADLSDLSNECNNLLSNGADYLHLDVMDGHFVPNLTFGAPVVKCLRNRVTSAFFDMHMMVQHPKDWVKDISAAGANQYTFHIESLKTKEEVFETIQLIKDANMLVGLAVKPNTEIEEILPFIDLIDMALVMTVEPGFGGQKFMGDMMKKVRFLRERFQYLDIEVDGGVGISTIEQCAEAGANMIVSGSAITSSDRPGEIIKNMKTTMKKYIF